MAATQGTPAKDAKNCPFTAYKDANKDSKDANKEAPICAQCVSGSIHKGLPRGTISKIHGLDTYTVGNTTSPSAVIVMYSDIFGLALPNNKILADAYADANPDWLVHVPDFFEGDPAPLKFSDVAIPVDQSKQSNLSFFTGMLATGPGLVAWMMRHKEGPTWSVCSDWLEKLRRETLPQGKKVGMVGFCWGGRYTARAALEKNMIKVDGKDSGSAEKRLVPLVDAAIALHPSNMVVPEDVEGICVPLTFGWGEKDTMTKIETMSKVKEVLKKESDSGRQMPEVEHKVYSPGRHGFGVRGNLDDPAEKKILEDTHQQVVDWFTKWL